MKVIIVRGLPGTGRSDLINSFQPKSGYSKIVCSVDEFLNSPNDYLNSLKLIKAKQECFIKFKKCMSNPLVGLIVVQGPYFERSDLFPYIKHSQLTFNHRDDIEVIRYESSQNKFRFPKSFLNKKVEKVLPHWPSETIIKR